MASLSELATAAFGALSTADKAIGAVRGLTNVSWLAHKAGKYIPSRGWSLYKDRKPILLYRGLPPLYGNKSFKRAFSSKRRRFGKFRPRYRRRRRRFNPWY